MLNGSIYPIAIVDREGNLIVIALEVHLDVIALVLIVSRDVGKEVKRLACLHDEVGQTDGIRSNINLRIVNLEEVTRDLLALEIRSEAF